MDQTIKQLVRTAHMLADEARRAVLPFFRSADLTAENKLAGGFAPVTEGDKAAERAMRAILARERPMDGIIGEEYGAVSGSSEYTWVLDPIDGTRGFLSGTPTWGVLIAVNDAGGPVVGMIDQPYIGERFWGAGGVAQMTGPQSGAEGVSTIRARGGRGLDQAILFTTFPEVGSPDEEAGFRAVAERVRLVRYGMDCYAYALLAAGQIDLVIEAGLSSYDVCGPIGVIQAAGGIVTDWQGGPAHGGGRVLAAANAEQHAAALDILRRVPG